MAGRGLCALAVGEIVGDRAEASQTAGRVPVAARLCTDSRAHTDYISCCPQGCHRPCERSFPSTQGARIGWEAGTMSPVDDDMGSSPGHRWLD